MSRRSFYDLVEPGITLELGSHTFEVPEIIKFATKFDPQPFHLSEEAARHSLFGGLVASGWHTGAMWMKHNVTNGQRQLLELTGYDGQGPVHGPSPGLRNLKWPAPVYAGDTIRFFSTITEKRTNPGRPGWGLLLDHSGGFNQHGKLVLSMDGAVTIKTDV